MTRDPVCGMPVDPKTSPHRAEHAGRRTSFCSACRRERFLTDPAQFLTAQAAPSPTHDTREYTCPMHPEVVQRGPGSCPICGMALEREGQTVMLVAVNGALAGLLGVIDPIKPSTAEALYLLAADGIAVRMLTGDSRATAAVVADKLALTDFEAEVLPDQKRAFVERLMAEGRTVAMAGDGVNDAPALALAHVGIAMGTGTDIAIETAGVTLVRGDLRGIGNALRLRRVSL